MTVPILVKSILLVAIVVLVCTEAKRKSKGSKTRGGQKYSGKCKSKIMAEYEIAFYGGWSEVEYPRMFPKYRPTAQWSKLIGKAYFYTFLDSFLVYHTCSTVLQYSYLHE